tara:strand:+ start:5865 stop:7340 length:1476 start_codon:yes stop_codon:yes gene_type:complete
MAQNDRDTFDKVGQYNLEEIAILSYQFDKEESLPRKLDIKGILYNFEIAEDIMTNNVVGSAIVYDMQDIRTMLPITGLERLSLKFNSPGTPGYDFTEVNGIPLQIYKIDNVRRDPDTDKAQLYQIFFCSPEMYRNSITKISKAYTGPVENGVADILRNYLKSEKPFYFEPTATNSKIVIPNLNPYQAIQLLAKSAIPKNYPENAGYVFYETSQGYYFRSVASMMAIGQLGSEVTPKWKYTSLIASISDNPKQPELKDIERRLSNVIKYEYDKPINTLDNIFNGLYASKTISHDAFNKTITTSTYDYNEKGKKQPHMEMRREAGLLYPENVEYDDTRKPLTQMFDSKLMVKSDTSKIHNDYENRGETSGLSARISMKQGMRNSNLSLLVYGNTLLTAGDVITFTTPLMRPVGPGEQEENNPYTSGRYLIMAIKHMVNVETQNHEMVIKCFKDSVRSAYPTEEEALSNVGKGTITNYNLYDEQYKEFYGDVYV